MTLSLAQFTHIFPGVAYARAAEYLPFFNASLEEADITTPKRIAAYCAQVGHESADFRYFEEIWGPTRAQKGYEGRKDLGNTHAGDGHRYMGRGPIQVTGRANYRAAGEALSLDLEGNPEQAATPEVGFRVAGWYWTTRGLNKYADRDQFETLTRRINGGLNGLDDRLERWARAKRALAAAGYLTHEASTTESAAAGAAAVTAPGSGPAVSAAAAEPEANLEPAADMAAAGDAPAVPASGSDASPTHGSAGADTPQVTVETSGGPVNVAAPVATVPIAGGSKDDEPKVVTQSWSARVAAALTGAGVSVATAWQFISAHPSEVVIVACIVGGVVIGLAYLIRSTILDRERIKANKDPGSLNVV